MQHYFCLLYGTFFPQLLDLLIIPLHCFTIWGLPSFSITKKNLHLQFLDDVFPQRAVGLFDLVNNIIVIGYKHVNIIEQGQTQRGGGGLLTPPYPPHPNANQGVGGQNSVIKIPYPKP